MKDLPKLAAAALLGSLGTFAVVGWTQTSKHSGTTDLCLEEMSLLNSEFNALNLKLLAPPTARETSEKQRLPEAIERIDGRLSSMERVLSEISARVTFAPIH